MRRLVIGRSLIELIQGDITEVCADAIVNAANSALAGGGGVDGAIHRRGGPAIIEECRRIGGCPTGSAVMTGAGKLDARHVIHAVAPRYRGSPQDAVALRGAYRKSLELAVEAGDASLAFPSLGTGAYRYPVDEAAKVALSTVAEFILASAGTIDKVTFVLFSADDLAVYERALEELAVPRN